MNPKKSPRSRLRRAARFLCILVLVIVALGMARCWYAFRDRNPGYTLDINIDGTVAESDPQPLRVGFGRVNISPDLSDPERPVWMAGFGNHRAATAIHDDLWAVACVIDDGHTRVGIVALDAIGFFHDDVIRVRQGLRPGWGIDYTIVCSTHNHSTPDLMGLWGPSPLQSGVDPDYLERVIDGAVEALGTAVSMLQPVRVRFHEIPMETDGLVADTRLPEVFDPDIRLMHFTLASSGGTLGTVVTWGNHPETPWSRNTEITADFPGFLREALEHGVRAEGRLMEAGLGGTHLYINGAIGGLMSTTPEVSVRDPYLDQEFKEPSHEKSRAVGRQMASRILPRLWESSTGGVASLPISVRARTIEVPLENTGFLLAPVLGVIDRGHLGWRTLRTEVALLTLGDVSVACIPGEIYPELVNGGVERSPGGDFDIDPLELPPIRELMPGRIKFVFGLANDEIGYIIPKSQWDRKPPYLHGAEKPVYGEINSVGPETASLIHAALRELAR